MQPNVKWSSSVSLCTIYSFTLFLVILGSYLNAIVYDNLQDFIRTLPTFLQTSQRNNEKQKTGSCITYLSTSILPTL